MKKIYFTLFASAIGMLPVLCTAQPWEVVGNASFGSAYTDNYKHLEMINDQPHVIFRDQDATLKIKKFENNVWIAPDDSLIAATWDEYREYETTVDQNGNLLVIYHNPDIEKVIVKKFDGNNWTVVGAPFGFPSGSNYPHIQPIGTDKLVALIAEVDSATFASAGILSLYEYNGTTWNRIAENISDTSTSYCDMVVNANDDIYVSYITSNFVLYVEKYNGTTWEVMSGGSPDTNQVSGNELYLDDNDNLLLVSRNRLSSYNWEFRRWTNNAWELLPSPNHLYAINGTVMNVSNHALSFNSVDQKWYIAFTLNTNSMSFFKRFNGTEWEQVGDSLYADPGYVRYGKMRFNDAGNPFYTSSYSKVMTMDLNLVPSATPDALLTLNVPYPNPTTATVRLDVTTPTTVTIYNTQQQVVSTVQIDQDQSQIEMSSLPTGVYFLETNNDTQHQVFKVVKH